MSNKHNQTNVKICNHKPGDTWEDGCCGDEQAKNKSSETISDTRSVIPPVYRVQKNQVSKEQDDTSINPQK